MCPLLTRRNFIKTGAVIAVAGATGIATDAIAFQASDPVLKRVELPISRLPESWDGFRIAQLSDFHYDPYFSAVPIRKAVEVVNRLQPDLIVLTGDFVTQPMLHGFERNNEQPVLAIEPCAKLLSKLKSRGGVFAILGNHDVSCGADAIADTLQTKNITVLRNHALPLENGGKRMWLGGVDDVLEGTPDLDKTLRGVPREEPVILLSHEPDFADSVQKYPVDLQLSGHSHGGQIRLPLLGPPYLPPLGRKYPLGLYKLGPLTVYTNVGLGTIRIPARWNCPPEITVFTLRAGLKANIRSSLDR